MIKLFCVTQLWACRHVSVHAQIYIVYACVHIYVIYILSLPRAGGLELTNLWGLLQSKLFCDSVCVCKSTRQFWQEHWLQLKCSFTAKNVQTLTSAGTRDLRDLFSMLLTRLVRRLGREKTDKNYQRSCQNPRLDIKKIWASPVRLKTELLCRGAPSSSLIRDAASPELPEASAGITGAQNFVIWIPKSACYAVNPCPNLRLKFCPTANLQELTPTLTPSAGWRWSHQGGFCNP